MSREFNFFGPDAFCILSEIKIAIINNSMSKFDPLERGPWQFPWTLSYFKLNPNRDPPKLTPK